MTQTTPERAATAGTASTASHPTRARSWSGHYGLVLLISGPAQLDDPALELAVSMALVRRASRGELGDTLRVYHPSASVVAFGRRDTHRPGYPAALRRAREAGFEPLVRPAALVAELLTLSYDASN